MKNKRRNIFMDQKACQILHHYKHIFETQTFDEYDVLGFLIFIRTSIIDNDDFKRIEDYAHLIAHRKRDRGRVMDSISAAMDNNYQTEKDSTKIKGFQGIYENEWIREWEDLGKKYNIEFNDAIIKDLTVCIFSLAQHSFYNDGDGANHEKTVHEGTMDLLCDDDGYLNLYVTEGKPDSLCVIYQKCGPFQFNDTKQVNYGDAVVETFRKDGVLHLQDTVTGNLIL